MRKFAFLLALSTLLSCLLSANFALVSVKASNSYPVHNRRTGIGYQTIQEAIDANVTLAGDVITVDEGIYYEHVFINKSLTIVGTKMDTTIVDSSGSYRGFQIYTPNVNLTGFTVQNARWAIYGASNQSRIYGNKLRYSGKGIYLDNASSCQVSENSVENIAVGGEGIFLRNAEGTIIQRNTITNISYGISFVNSYNNIVRENTITNCSYALSLSISTSNTFYHNNFCQNSQNVELFYSLNNWDYGYPSGGNYWSDYVGIDHFSGLHQNMTGKDGVGDTPYDIGAETQDKYPLINPYTPTFCDLNDDRIVDMKDIAIAAKAFHSYPNHPRWTPFADVNHDSEINIVDMALIAKNFGKSSK